MADRGASPTAAEWQSLAAELLAYLGRQNLPCGCEAADLVQESLWRALRVFANSRPATCDARRAYLRRTAKSVLADAVRFLRSRPQISEAGGMELEAGSTPDDSEEELREQLLRSLDGPAVELFLLTRWHGCSHEEARVRLSLGRKEAAAARKRYMRFLSTAGHAERLLKSMGVDRPPPDPDPRTPNPEPRTPNPATLDVIHEPTSHLWGAGIPGSPYDLSCRSNRACVRHSSAMGRLRLDHQLRRCQLRALCMQPAAGGRHRGGRDAVLRGVQVLLQWRADRV